MDVVNNEAEHRYELKVDGEVAFAAYRAEDGALLFHHTVVPPALGGRGIASQLIKGALADVRAKGLKVVPVCSFVAAYFDKHPEEQDLLSTNAPG